ncbi:B12-binding domain-containing radical SAM protein [Cellulosilyticum sp. I15G10I2]|uniref:B12-binding domain-containing radical SAM protein n=1 Tax=Cellulosilyticum sp. I15G10I2 TaxID=1892843 RepID=UPI00085C3723|nr:radical SAM protein [Cellulosilyticum sp. I15G10I2]
MRVLMVCPEETYTMLMHTKIPKRWAYVIEIASYIKSQGYDVKVMDCLNPKISHGEVFNELASNEYDAVILTARIESARSILKISPIIKQISPKSKVIVYGDISNYAPNFFKYEGVDAVVENGDWECAIIDYLKFVEGVISEKEVGGVSFRLNGTWHPANKGKEAPNNSWSFPEFKSGIADNELYLSITGGELTISVSRGCPFNCHFCPAVITFKEHDRRKKPEDVVSYIKEHKHLVNDFKLFSPTLTLDVEWVKKLCRLLIDSKCNIRWSATTRPNCLKDEEMVRLMSESGCHKLALGVETLDDESTKKLGKFSDTDIFTETKNAITLLKKHNIEAKTLMMLGIEGQTSDNIYQTFELLKSWGADIRVASYSPRGILKDKDNAGVLITDDIETMDKMTYQHIEIPGVSRKQFLELIYNTENYRNILQREGDNYVCYG